VAKFYNQRGPKFNKIIEPLDEVANLKGLLVKDN
jgi:hypothetical protein